MCCAPILVDENFLCSLVAISSAQNILDLGPGYFFKVLLELQQLLAVSQIWILVNGVDEIGPKRHPSCWVSIKFFEFNGWKLGVTSDK